MCDKTNGPGKFENEPCYAEAVYAAMLDGFTETIYYPDGGIVNLYYVDESFCAVHRVGLEIVAIALEESDLGFVYFQELTAAGVEELRIKMAGQT